MAQLFASNFALRRQKKLAEAKAQEDARRRRASDHPALSGVSSHDILDEEDVIAGVSATPLVRPDHRTVNREGRLENSEYELQSNIRDLLHISNKIIFNLLAGELQRYMLTLEPTAQPFAPGTEFSFGDVDSQATTAGPRTAEAGRRENPGQPRVTSPVSSIQVASGACNL